MQLTVLNVSDVAAAQLCSGCGVCAYLDPQRVEMVDVLDHGRRPLMKPGFALSATTAALGACPGLGLEHRYDRDDEQLIGELADAWGPVYQLYEGYAGDEEIRFHGSSGGAATALALFCLEQQGMHGVLHTAAREDVPYLNTTVMSHSREELLARTGSRYAPASPCDGLQQIADGPGPSVFIGKPCDVAAAQAARRMRPELDANLGLVIGFFCAGTPTTRGTLEMLARMGVTNPEQLVSLRYRGKGWPGMATAVFRDGDGTTTRELTYDESWGGVLQKHRQWRCHVCADHTGEFADVAVGDPWYRTPRPGEPGQSLIVARTRRGRAIIESAIAAGYLHAVPVEPDILPRSQPNLLQTRGSIWGRILTCRILGAAAPRYANLPMFRFWLRELTLKQKIQSLTGTVRRIYRRKLRQRQTMHRFEPQAGLDPQTPVMSEGHIAAEVERAVSGSASAAPCRSAS